MSGPFGNPAMGSSGGGGGGPHITGALEFGTKGSNPTRWSIAGAGLGYPNYTSFKADFSSRPGMTFWHYGPPIKRQGKNPYPRPGLFFIGADF